MSPESGPVALTLEIDAGEEADEDRLDRLTRQLRAELQELDVESAELASGGELPPGARAAELAALGELAVAVLPAAIPPMIEFLNSWLLRGENRKVKITTKVGDRSIEAEYSPGTMSHEELQELTLTLMASLEGQKRS